MHIAALTYYYLPVINGVTLTIADWKKAAETHGVAYTVYTSQSRLPLVREPHVFEFPAVPVYSRMGFTIPLFPYLFLKQEMQKQEIDCIHVHHIFSIGKLAIRLGSALHIPVVFTYHTQYLDYVRLYFPFLPKWFVRMIINRSIVNLMNRCQAVTVALPYLKKKLLRRGVVAPIHVVPIGVDTMRFSHGERATARRILHVQKHDIVLLGTGRMEREKNWKFVLRAFRYLLRSYKQIRLVLVGSGTYLSHLQQLARKMNITDNIQFISRVTPSDMPNYYAAGDIYVSASVTETFGRVIVEAMAAGLPVVALATAANRDIIKDNVSGILVKKRNIRLFAEKIELLVRGKKKRLAIGKMAQEHVRRGFDISKSWTCLEQVYKKVANEA